MINSMFEFEKFYIYQKGLEFHKSVFNLLKQNPKIDYHFQDQLKRANTSIIANLAEGIGRFSPADKRHFYIMSRGSVYEAVALLTLIFKSYPIDQLIHEELRSQLKEIIKMLTGLIKSKTE
jgi:four helix bundle protein